MNNKIWQNVAANEADLNRDPLSGTPGAQLAGKSAAESINPTSEEMFWRETYVREPYYLAGKTFAYYAAGFRAGWEGRVRHDGRSFEDAEADLKASYIAVKSKLDAEWIDVRPAARAAWNRVDHSLTH